MTTEMTSPAEGPDRGQFPVMAAEPGRVEPAPRRVRAFLDGHQVFDTTRASYVWEWP